MSLSEAQKKLIKLEKAYPEIKKYFEKLDEVTAEVAKEIGVGGMFQDPEDGTVYQIVKPEGKFVSYKDVDFVRTRRAYLGEERADLSLKKAEEAGFTLGDNQKKVVKSE